MKKLFKTPKPAAHPPSADGGAYPYEPADLRASPPVRPSAFASASASASARPPVKKPYSVSSSPTKPTSTSTPRPPASTSASTSASASPAAPVLPRVTKSSSAGAAVASAAPAAAPSSRRPIPPHHHRPSGDLGLGPGSAPGIPGISPASAPASPSASLRRKKHDSGTHPLNLPPEERDRKRLSARSAASAASAMSSRASTDTDRDSPPAPPAPSSPSRPPHQHAQAQAQAQAQARRTVSPRPPSTSHFSASHQFASHTKRVPSPPMQASSSTSPPPAAAAAAANGAAKEDVPVPPPHKTPAPTPAEEAETFKAAGNTFFKERNFRRAIEEYTKAVNLQPQSSTYLSNRAAAYMSAGNYSAALEDCQRAADLDPQNAKVLLRLARIYCSLGQPEDAILTFGRIQPPPAPKDTAAAREMLHHVNAAREALASGTSGSMVLHALDQASRLLGPSALQPRKWQLMRGEAYLKMGGENNIGEAANIAISLLRFNNKDPEAIILRGRALYAQGDNVQAERHFRRAIEMDPDLKEAIKWLRVVQKLDRMKEDGNSDFKAGRWQSAIDKYTAALKVDPNNRSINAKLLQNRALCEVKLKQYDAAIADCDAAIGFDANYSKARKTKATALGAAERWEDAIREWKVLAERDSEDRTILKEIRRAELELKKSQRKNYYAILGITKDADEKDIKRAYRKLAVIHHPDKNPGDAQAEARFKDIGEAYETLSDPQKRARYDSGEDLMDPSDMFSSGGGGMHGGIDPDILFSMMGGQGGGGFGGGGFGGGGGFPGGGGGGFHFNQSGGGRQRGFPSNFQFQ